MVRTRIPCHPFIILGSMADIQYLNYGDLQIELLALLNNLADQVVGYVESKPWSKKRKEKFMLAYSDIMTRGIVGASNKTGQWIINVNGTIDFDSKDKKDKEMYQEAAYFILQQMAGLPTKQSKEELEKIDKSKLQKFNNDFFTRDFVNYLSELEFGGLKFSTLELWNPLDKRGDNGLRDTKNRRRILAQRLKEYADSLDETKYNFEEGPFKNLSNFKSRVDAAVRALNTDDNPEDEITALNALGLNPNNFLYNGANDPSGYSIDGLPLTWEQYNKLKEAEAARLTTQPSVQPPVQPTKSIRSDAYYDYKENIPKTKLEKSLSTTIGDNNGLTDDMKADLAAMGLDLVSAGAASIPGYGTLTSALTGIGSTISSAVADRMRGESWGSTLGTAGFGLSMDILGLIPGVGVGAKAAKIAKVVAKGAKWLGHILGGLAAMSYGPGAISAYNKFKSGKKDEITAEELRDFTYAIRAIAAGGIRKAGATYLGNRTLARAKAKGHVVETTGRQAASITTKNGEIKLTDEEFKILKGNGDRESKIKLLKNKGVKEEDIEWKGINPARGRFRTSSKSSKLSGLNEPVESSQLRWNTTSADYKGIRRFSNENLLRGFTTMSYSSPGIWRSIRDRWTGLDILNRAASRTTESQKLFPFIRQEYVKPQTTSERVIPLSRALPEPGGTHKGTIVDNIRPGTLNAKHITLGEANQEFNDFHRMYIASSTKNSKVASKPFGNGYGTSKEPENGSIDFDGITATLTKLNDNKGFSITFGKTGETVIAKQYKNILQLRNDFATLLNKVIKKLNNVKETAALLRQFKAKGWLKQGGTIDKRRIQRYKEFIKK